MTKRTKRLLILLSTIGGTLLFHKQEFGINLLIFEFAIFSWFIYSGQFSSKEKISKVIGIGLVLSSFATVFVHTDLSYILNLLSFFLLLGASVFPESKSLLITLGQSFYSTTHSFIRGLPYLLGSSDRVDSEKKPRGRIKIFIIPTLIIFLFIGLYSLSNEQFGDAVSKMLEYTISKVYSFLENIDLSLLFTILLSLTFSLFIFIKKRNETLAKKDKEYTDELKDTSSQLLHDDLKSQAIKDNRAGIFLLVSLNILLLILNILDVQSVWLYFSWDGHSLKQFVHTGTYILIFSVLISIFLVLYYFKGNLNYYPKNKNLKILSSIWLAQNAFLLMSVALRNFRYIDIYSLAYKRIGVIIFLVLTLIGLFTVLLKVKQKKSTYFLFRVNSLVIYVVLLLCSLINWDTFIAKYNFSNAKQSYLHYDFMAKLSDKTLPYIYKEKNQLEEIDLFQRSKFGNEYNFLSPERYWDKIEDRRLKFLNTWQSKNFLEWNYPEYSAYQKLKRQP